MPPSTLARAFRPPRRLPGPKRRWECCRWTPLALQRAIGVPMSPRERTPLTKTNIPDRDPANLRSSLFLENVTFLFGKHKAFSSKYHFLVQSKIQRESSRGQPGAAQPSPAGARIPRIAPQIQELRGSRPRIRRAERIPGSDPAS